MKIIDDIFDKINFSSKIEKPLNDFSKVVFHLVCLGAFVG